MAINMRTMGTILVRKVRDALQMAHAQNGEEEHSIVQFQAQENGCKANEKAGRIQDSLDWQFANKLDLDRPILFLLDSWWSG